MKVSFHAFKILLVQLLWCVYLHWKIQSHALLALKILLNNTTRSKSPIIFYTTFYIIRTENNYFNFYSSKEI